MSSLLKRSETYLYDVPSYLKVTGDDTASFLQSQFSNNLITSIVKSATYGLWLDKKGHVLADSHILAIDSETYYIFSEHTNPQFIRATLEQHIVADDVMIEAVPVLGCASTSDEGFRDFLQYLGLAYDLDSEQFVESEAFGVAFKSKRLMGRGFEIYFTEAKALESFHSFISSYPMTELSSDEMNLRRINLGIPLIPNEIGKDDLAGEGDLVPSAASLTKGCYLGQEVVSRLYHLGTPQRGLYVVSLLSDVETLDIQLPEILLFEGRKIGELRTLYYVDGKASSWMGVALLKERFIGSFEKGVELNGSKIQLVRKLKMYDE